MLKIWFREWIEPSRRKNERFTLARYMNTPQRRVLIGTVGLIWLILIIGLYYITHKPFDPVAFVHLLLAAGQCICAAGILALAGGLGAWIYPANDLPPLARLVIQAGAGIGVLALLFLLAGASLGLSAYLLWGELVAGLLLLRKPLLAWLRLWSGVKVLLNGLTFMERFLAASAILMLAMAFVISLSPPLAFDALVYHLALPRLYLQAGRIVYVPQIMFWGMPQTGEMLYTWGMGLAGEQTAALIGWGFGLLTLVGLAGVLQAYVSRRVAWVAVASLIAGYTLAISLSWAYIDWLMGLWGFCFFTSLLQWRFSRSYRSLFATGAFAGFAFATKYTGGLLALISIFVLAWDAFRKRLDGSKKENQLPIFMRRLLVFSGAAAMVALPWLLKNWIATGNPFYPLIFPAGAMDAVRLRLYQSVIPWGGWQDALLLPLRATYWGVEGANGYGASIGPLLLGLGLPAVLGLFLPGSFVQPDAGQENQPVGGVWPIPPLRLTISTAAWIALLGVLIWAIAGRLAGYLLATRLYYDLFPAFAVIAGAGMIVLESIHTSQVRFGRIASAMLLLVVALNLYEVGSASIKKDTGAYLMGFVSRQQYLEQNLGAYAAAMQRINQLPAGSRVLMIWETRSYYCLPVCTPDEVLDRWRTDIAHLKDPQAVLQSWRAAGFTHILYYRSGANFLEHEDVNFRGMDWAQLDHLMAQLPQVENIYDSYELYRIQ
jgi:hypothetical protein